MKGPALRFVQADAFTEKPFGGNPAAVFLLEAPLEYDAMSVLASEMNLSESAFVGPPRDDGTRELRWFTPTVEVSLCGHATLASAHVLHEAGAAPPYRFTSLAGELRVDRMDDGAFRLDFPSDDPREIDPPFGLLPALGCDGALETAAGDRVWVVRVPTEDDVRLIRPDFGLLREVDLRGERLGVTVTATAWEGDGFVSRFFAPWVGIDEDPVTGVAHTALAPFWAERLEREELPAAQLSRRGGRLTVRTAGDRVHLIGHCVTVAEGSVLIP